MHTESKRVHRVSGQLHPVAPSDPFRPDHREDLPVQDLRRRRVSFLVTTTGLCMILMHLSLGDSGTAH